MRGSMRREGVAPTGCGSRAGAPPRRNVPLVRAPSAAQYSVWAPPTQIWTPSPPPSSLFVPPLQPLHLWVLARHGEQQVALPLPALHLRAQGGGAGGRAGGGGGASPAPPPPRRAAPSPPGAPVPMRTHLDRGLVSHRHPPDSLIKRLKQSVAHNVARPHLERQRILPTLPAVLQHLRRGRACGWVCGCARVPEGAARCWAGQAWLRARNAAPTLPLCSSTHCQCSCTMSPSTTASAPLPSVQRKRARERVRAGVRVRPARRQVHS